MVATAQRFHELNPQIEISWTKRSLQEFADQPIAELAERFDLLVMDHPWAGFAAASGVLFASTNTSLVNSLRTKRQILSERRTPVIIPATGQWALAIDAACPVSVCRPDLLKKENASVPRTFDELVALGKRGLVCCPSIPLDTYGNFLNLLMAAGEKIFCDDAEIAERSSDLRSNG